MLRRLSFSRISTSLMAFLIFSFFSAFCSAVSSGVSRMASASMPLLVRNSRIFPVGIEARRLPLIFS